MIAAHPNLAVPSRLGELGQSSQGHGGRHGIGRPKTKQALANSCVSFLVSIEKQQPTEAMQTEWFKIISEEFLVSRLTKKKLTSSSSL